MAKNKRTFQSSALLCVILGVLFIIFKQAVIEWTVVAFGVFVVFKGVLDLCVALKNKRVFPVIVAVFTIVAGVLLILNKWVQPTWFYIALGVILIIDGLIDLVR
ncbi:MAG: DUF308 domain-containing protein [Clostridia bacterium]|nr:DUF308 domain-containing protein [Clostridia bacterium]